MINNNFRTEIQILRSNTLINHQDKLLMIGSCFAENIGEKLIENKFQLLLNPFGVLYNPASIAQCLNNLVFKEKFTEEDVFFHNEEWFSFQHHSDFSHSNQQDCLRNINQQFLASKAFLKTADFLLITLGSSIAYQLKSTRQIVANCHKLPADTFHKIHLNNHEISQILKESIDNIKHIKPNIKIIFTLSPVRYIKDSFIENSLSKAHLRIAIDDLINTYESTEYFPAFEIMMDDLRDYRFYQLDNIHPSPLSIDYIWNIFSQTYFSEETQKLNRQIDEITNAYHHNIKNENTEAAKKFKNKFLVKINKLLETFPYLDFSNEKKHFQ